MASNATPLAINELIAAGEDLCDGLNQHGVTIGVSQNTFVRARADLDALLAAQAEFNIAQSNQLANYAALRAADSNGKGFIAPAR